MYQAKVHKNGGADLSKVKEKLDGSFVIKVVPAASAFCALTDDGNVISWGYKIDGGDCSEIRKQLKKILK